MKERWSEKIPRALGLYWVIPHGTREVRIVELRDVYGEIQVYTMGWDIGEAPGRGLWMKARRPSPPAEPKDYRG